MDAKEASIMYKKHIFVIDDLLKIIDYWCKEINLSKKEIKNYDRNGNGIIDYKDYLDIYEQILLGKFKYRTEPKLYVLKKYLKKLNSKKNKSLINMRDFKKLDRGIKSLSTLLKRDEYSDDTNRRGFGKKTFQSIDTLKKLGYNLNVFLEK